MSSQSPSGSNTDRNVGGAVPVRPKSEMTFGKTFLASLLGNLASWVVAGIVVGGLVAMIIATSFSASEERPVVLDDSMLEISLSGSIPETEESIGLAGLLEGAGDYTFLEVIAAIDHAAEDEQIPGIRINFNGFAGSSAQYEELVSAMLRFRESGKFIYAFSDTDGFSEGEYFVASAADSIFLNRSGGIELNGLYVVLEFYRPLMEKLNIKPLVVRAGSYKAAVEPFTRNEPSEEYREATTAILEGMQEIMIETIAENRGISPQQIETIMQEFPILRAEDALRAGLVDRLIFDDEIDDMLLARLDSDRDSPRMIQIGEYVDIVREDFSDGSSDEIAVIYASGGITTGEGGNNPNPILGGAQVGSNRFIRNLREAREDEDVRAVVLRVDSPGGGLPPSVEMWREVGLTAAVKPVVVSMGGVAASGGYYISAPATEIFADAMTVTGSIGVFALAFNMDGLYEETIGINTEVISTAPHADLLSLTRDLTPDEEEFAAREIDAVYNEFLQVVAEGRDMPIDRVREYAEGRVWTGRMALELGLVDEIGGLHDALQRAARLAEIEDDYDIRVIPRRMDEFERILSMFDEFSSASYEMKLMQFDQLKRQLHEELRRESTLQVRMTGFGGVQW